MGGPHIGMFPPAKAKPAADACCAVRDKVDDGFTYGVQVLIEMPDVEHEAWECGKENLDRSTPHTIFFSSKG
ncbi:hypothetical protein GCM10010211_67670 [Streptomyces albospinus]|uniref:Uncharacterized protein n=2 Tax=Streptomyces albospinus TaxID=285515 RepID=A0ABQ2VLS4_9ACTN|nr:hypothetical protein GCM10010211_67670 [Streptomyces albospinus]